MLSLLATQFGNSTIPAGNLASLNMLYHSSLATSIQASGLSSFIRVIDEPSEMDQVDARWLVVLVSHLILVLLMVNSHISFCCGCYQDGLKDNLVSSPSIMLLYIDCVPDGLILSRTYNSGLYLLHSIYIRSIVQLSIHFSVRVSWFICAIHYFRRTFFDMADGCMSP